MLKVASQNGSGHQKICHPDGAGQFSGHRNGSGDFRMSDPGKLPGPEIRFRIRLYGGFPHHRDIGRVSKHLCFDKKELSRRRTDHQEFEK